MLLLFRRATVVFEAVCGFNCRFQLGPTTLGCLSNWHPRHTITVCRERSDRAKTQPAYKNPSEICILNLWMYCCFKRSKFWTYLDWFHKTSFQIYIWNSLKIVRRGLCFSLSHQPGEDWVYKMSTIFSKVHKLFNSPVAASLIQKHAKAFMIASFYLKSVIPMK